MNLVRDGGECSRSGGKVPLLVVIAIIGVLIGLLYDDMQRRGLVK